MWINYRASFFGIFTGGITVSSLQLALYNLSTIENLNRKSKVWILAIRVPHWDVQQKNATYPTITYPLPPPSSSSIPSFTHAHQDRGGGRGGGGGEGGGEQHVFAIVRTRPGENPFDLGGKLKNLQQVFGYTLDDWLLPLRRSPCANHNSKGCDQSEYAYGPVLARLKREIGLVSSA